MLLHQIIVAKVQLMAVDSISEDYLNLCINEFIVTEKQTDVEHKCLSN